MFTLMFSLNNLQKIRPVKVLAKAFYSAEIRKLANASGTSPTIDA